MYPLRMPPGRTPMGCHATNRNPYGPRYDGGKERQRPPGGNSMAMIAAVERARQQAQQPQQPRNFGRSHRWGAPHQGGGRPSRLPQFSFASSRSPLFGQMRSPFGMPMRPAMGSHLPSMHRRNPLRPTFSAPRHGSAYTRFNAPPLSRGYPPRQAPFLSRRQYRRRPDDDDEDDDDDDIFAEDDDDWGESDTEDPYDWDSGGDDDDDDNDYYDEYSRRGSSYSPYRNQSARYEGYSHGNYSERIDPAQYYSGSGYGRSSQPQYQSPYQTQYQTQYQPQYQPQYAAW